jgi:ketosteroid isomerase-like protein
MRHGIAATTVGAPVQAFYGPRRRRMRIQFRLRKGVPFLLLTAACSSETPVPIAMHRSADTCAVQGAWTLDRATVEGRGEVGEQGRVMKVVSATHWTWVRQGSGPSTLQSAADSLRAFRTGTFGGGTYRLDGSTYTEHLDYFFDPQYVGREITASCRVEGDRWEHSFDWPVMEAGRETGRVRIDEVWRRIEPATQWSSGPDAAEAELRQLESAYHGAVAAADLDAVLDFYTDDIVSLPPGEPLQHGKAWIGAVLAEYARDYELNERFSFSAIRPIDGDRVATLYEYSMSATPRSGGEAYNETGKGMAVLRRSTDGRWRFEWNAWNQDP